MYDVVIAGGGPAGLSAALILGRCRRSVLVCDSGGYRNDVARELHGFLTRDGITPSEFRRIARRELCAYDVSVRSATVVDARQRDGWFEVELEGGERVYGRKLLLATGLVDVLPPVEGLRELYGESVFQTPYCDAWEVRDQPLAVYGRGADGVELAQMLTRWSTDIVLCTDGPAHLHPEDAARLASAGVGLREERILRLERRAGQLARIVFEGGGGIERRAMFLKPPQRQRSDLAEKLGCVVTRERGVETGPLEETSVRGVFVAGDASRDVLLAVVAAAEGATAAFGINRELQEEDADQAHASMVPTARSA